MEYPQVAKPNRGDPHDYRRYYPASLLSCGNFFAGYSATFTGEAVSKRIGYNRHPVFSERWLLSSLLSLAQARVWQLVWRRDVTRANTARTLAQNASGMVPMALSRSHIFYGDRQ